MNRPCVKPEHLPVRIGLDRVQIGGDVPGIAAVIPDPDGWRWTLLVLLDGTRTVDQVVDDLVHRFPLYTEVDVRNAVDAFHAEGFLYDAGAAEPDLTPRQLDRYSRTRALWRLTDTRPRPGGWDAQVELSKAKVVQVGAGGLGCASALALAMSGVGRLHLVDGDVVERSNLTRQGLFTEDDIGMAKVVVAERELRARNHDVEITGSQLTVDGIAMLRDLADDCDVLVMAADTPGEIRVWTNRACLAAGRPWVHGGYHGPLVGVGMYRPGSGACYECGRTTADDSRITWWPGEVALVPPANAITAGYAGLTVAHATMSLITGVPAWQVNAEYRLNTNTWQSEVKAVEEAGCPACA